MLIELCLFGCQLRILGFQLFRAGQLGDVVCLKIGCCRPVRCQLCTMLLRKGCGSLGSIELLYDTLGAGVGCDVIAQLIVGFHATFEVFHHRQRIVILGFQFGDALVQGILIG